MLILYSSSGCASCRKAKQWLRDNHIEFIEKNIYTTLMKEDEIKYLLSRCENGTQDMIRLIQNNPSILKRPIILSKNNMVVGFDDEEITSFTPHHIRLRLEDRCPVSCANLDICRDVRKNESKESLVLDIT